MCVDMLGEGFDLPQLKIAVIHDEHQSPGVTLQFIGRLTRASSTLGTAKFVANIANQRSDGPIKRLYEENADWSQIIREMSSEKIGRELQKQKFEAKFEGDNDGARIVALNPTPNISSMAYRVKRKNWRPDRVSLLAGRNEELQLFSVSADQTVVMAVTKETSPVFLGEKRIDRDLDMALVPCLLPTERLDIVCLLYRRRPAAQSIPKSPCANFPTHCWR